MKIKLQTDFGIIPFVLADIKKPQDEMLLTGVLDRVDVVNANYTPFEISQIFYSTKNKWQKVLDDNGAEPFSFYINDRPEQMVLKPYENSELY